MLGTQYVLALVALYVGLAHSWSWDIVLYFDGKLDFYVKDTRTHSETIPKHLVHLMNYDAVNQRLLFSLENSHVTYDIASLNLKNMKIETLVKSEASDIYDIAYDPVRELIFWNNYYTSTIYWYSLVPGSQNNPNGNVLLKLKHYSDKDEIRIDVDSCRGYIYWTHYVSSGSSGPGSVIERARFNGTEREVLIEFKHNYVFEDLVIDQQTQKMYWVERHIDNDHRSVISADLTGKNRTLLYAFTNNKKYRLAVSKDYIYIYEHQYGYIPQIGKISKKSLPAIVYTTEHFTLTKTIALNYKVEEQIQGIQDCVELKSLLPVNSVTNDYNSLNVTAAADGNLFCVHGTKVSGESLCECTRGYIGERCDVSVCLNYCLEGNCSVSAEGQPKCSCNAGYSGTRCEINACEGYCLNCGVCFLNKNREPVCQCKEDYEGERCNVSVRLSKCFQAVSMFKDILNTDVSPGTLDKGENSTCTSTIV